MSTPTHPSTDPATRRSSRPGHTAAATGGRINRLLLFNLATDEDDPILGFTVNWVRALARRVPELDVVTMKAGRASLPGNVRVYSIGKERGWSEPRRLLEFYRRVFSLLHEADYDACFAHMQEVFALLAAPLLRSRRVPVTLWYTHPHTPWQLRAAVRCVDRVVTADPTSCRISTPKLISTGHGIDTDWFVPSFGTHPQFTVVAVGRIAPIKRLEFLVDAVAELRGRLGRPLEVRLVGPTDTRESIAYDAALRRYTVDRGVASQVTFVGPLHGQDLLAEYQAADALVSLTGPGSFDKSVLEAMSCGIPALTMNPAFGPHLREAGCPGPVTDGSAADLADALHYLADMPSESLRQCGLASRAEVLRAHSLPRLADLLVDEIL